MGTMETDITKESVTEEFKMSMEKLVSGIFEERKELLASLNVKESKIAALEKEFVRMRKEWDRAFEKRLGEIVETKELIIREKDKRFEEERKNYEKKINECIADLNNMENKLRAKEEEIKGKMVCCEGELETIKDRFLNERRVMEKAVRVKDSEIQKLKMENIDLKARLSSERFYSEKNMQDTKNKAIDYALRKLEAKLFEEKKEENNAEYSGGELNE